MDKILKKAMEGGYKTHCNKVKYKEKTKVVTFIDEDHEWDGTTSWNYPTNIHEVLCDPLFWQALGKACDWDYSEVGKIGNYVPDWEINANTFFMTNFAQGWDKAVAYLQEIISN